MRGFGGISTTFRKKGQKNDIKTVFWRFWRKIDFFPKNHFFFVFLTKNQEKKYFFRKKLFFFCKKLFFL